MSKDLNKAPATMPWGNRGIEGGKEAGHTALPWEAAEHGTTPGNTSLEIQTESGLPVAVLSYCGRAEANARFICQAVNSHKGLVEALSLDVVFHSRPFVRDSIAEFRAAGYSGPAESIGMRDFLLTIKQQALAKARGEG